MTQGDEGIPHVEQSPRPVIDASSPSMARKLAWTLGALSAFAPFSIDTYLPAFPRVAFDLGASIGLVEVTLAVFLLGMAIGQILWGILSDRSGRRVALVAGCLIFFLTAILCAVTHSIGVLIAARFIMGIGGSAGQVVARAIVRDLYEETEAARLYSMMMVVSGMAPIVAPFLGSLLLTYFNWRAIFWFIAAFAALCIAAVLAAIPETLPREARVRTETIDALLSCRRIFTHPGFIGPALMVAFLAGMMFTYIASSSYVFIDIFGVPVFFFGFLFATSSIGFYIGAQSNRWLLRRFHSRVILRRAVGINLGAALLLIACSWANVGGLPLFIGILFLCLATVGVILPDATAITMQPFAAEAGAASAWLGILQFFIGALGGGLVGLFHNGSPLPIAVQIGCFSLAAAAMLPFFPAPSA
jgi:DHA1 family bicyclomycin/chloramphenicol resistance-like MFS transporter